MKLSFIRHSKFLNKSVKSIAVLGGSGRDMGEEIKKIGGELLEMTEVEEQVAAGGAVALSPQEVNLAKRQAMLQTRASKARQRTLAKVKAVLPYSSTPGFNQLGNSSYAILILCIISIAVPSLLATIRIF